ncbi:lactoylglutathione lyase [Hoeflea marina]|uniref:Lactoylglutathione lyase n=1 Tax=Hoeflea marina TaxID=274592 RepID=A0A317PH45_9HYPH|nr:VOC family protein [Hoeflea marina]PWV98211.1 lactoylglutathione lyase [Hoeflea marina]
MIALAHVAYWCVDLDRTAGFWTHWFGASAGDCYVSSNQPGFRSRFVTLASGPTIELMQRSDIMPKSAGQAPGIGLSHIALSLGSVAAVDALAEKAAQAGILAAVPRRTGDGFYEAILFDPDLNQIEITA